MSESELIPPSDSENASARTMSKKERRELRRRARREAAEQEEREANEPEPEPTICAWCGFSAFFDEETSEAEKAKCPACTIAYDFKPEPTNGALAFVDKEERLKFDREMARDAVHRRIATALDSIFALLSEQWSEQWEAAQEMAEQRAGLR